jgi:threonine/homoserine/homoserine lactone efflux protein
MGHILQDKINRLPRSMAFPTSEETVEGLNYSQWLFGLARIPRIAVATITEHGQTVVCLLLTLGWILGMVCWTVGSAVVVKRKFRRRELHHRAAMRCRQAQNAAQSAGSAEDTPACQ